ncbi:site-specific integrase [Rhizobium ruizarguesonis]|uniref:site-specific integrase n=1 Tax=Rhizobium ruizarguesonis TaxID=2081791 RepID=UPI0010325BB3|nr:site-specific integrase [Rhizobium ruizarguesonis]TBA91096.1 site-specific integrase [Rhizobium ruizarguesonis]
MSKLTLDNPPYQSSKGNRLVDENDQVQLIAQANRSIDVPASVRELVAASVSNNTRRGYAADLRRFRSRGGNLPSDSAAVAVYLAEHADTHSVSTLRRWMASLSKAHTMAGYPDPTKTEPAKSTLRGICRNHGEAVSNAAPLLRDDIFAVLDQIGSGIRDARDRALLLIGFAGGFRRSELVGLNVTDIAFVRRGLVITLRRSKTDQTGIGREIGIPLGKTRHCPVAALEGWLRVASIESGAIFRPVDRHSHVGARRLSGEAVSIIVKERVAAIGIEPGRYSGHSLRAGFCTSAALAGVSSWKIRQQTGHASDAMLARYIRSAELFEDNATGSLL